MVYYLDCNIEVKYCTTAQPWIDSMIKEVKGLNMEFWKENSPIVPIGICRTAIRPKFSSRIPSPIASVVLGLTCLLPILTH